MTPEVIGSVSALVMKLFTVFGLGVYAVFAIIIVRQEQLMAKTLAESSERILRALTLIHLAATIAVILFAIILL